MNRWGRRQGWRRLGMAGLALLMAAAILVPQHVPAALATSLGLARVIGGTTASDSAVGRSIAVVGSTGKIWTTGQYAGTIDLDPGAGTLPATSNGGRDIYVSQLDANGNVVAPATVFGGVASDDTGFAITVDAAGNNYRLSNLDTDMNVVSANADVSAVAFNRTFTVLPGGQYFPRGIAVDGGGNVWVTGFFTGTVDANPDPAPGATLFLTSLSGSQDLFVIKLSSTGTLLLAQAIGGTSDDSATGIAVDGSGNVYITGSFQGTNVDFNPVGSPALLTSAGARDGYLLKLNNGGGFVFVKQFGGTGSDGGFGVTLDGSGNIFLTGNFSGTANFNPTGSPANLTSAGDTDAFVAKLNSAGTLQYASRFGGTGADIGRGIAVDGSSNAYLTGDFAGTASVTGSPTTLTSAGDQDVFLLKVNANGVLASAERFGSTGLDRGFGVALDGSANIYLTGDFVGTVDFDPSSGTAPLTSNTGDPTQSGAFVVKLVQAAPVNGLPAPQTTADTTPLVFSTANGNLISVADADQGSTPLRVTLAVNSGTLTLATIAGLSFTAGDGTADATMTFSGTLAAINTALAGLTFTPVAGAAASVTLQMTTLDLVIPAGGQSDTDSLTITVGRLPVAVNDSYAAANGFDLSVIAADGLLKNDTDADTAKAQLTVAAVTQPTKGILNIQPNGAFTYSPPQLFSGTDSFTYRVTDASGLTSNVATVSLTVNGVVVPVVNPTACGPRPTVTVQSAVAGGALQATVTATNTNAPNNQLQAIQFGTLQNAQVTLNGQAVTSGQTVTLPASTTTQTFTVRRATPGATTTVPLTVTDACGSWPSFVGGGAEAGF